MNHMVGIFRNNKRNIGGGGGAAETGSDAGQGFGGIGGGGNAYFYTGSQCQVQAPTASNGNYPHQQW